jgi:hypothetical protein
MTYREKLRDPRWQKLRLEVMSRDGWRCKSAACTARQEDRVMLVVHHKRYVAGREPWDYPANDLITLCEKCHDAVHQQDASDTQTALVENRFYRWHELGALVGHEPYGFLTETKGQIVCGCFRLDYNPDAPHIVLPGATNEGWVAKARLYVDQKTAVPIFTKDAGLPWEFVGKFRAEAVTQNQMEIAIHKARHNLGNVGAVLFLERKLTHDA